MKVLGIRLYAKGCTQVKKMNRKLYTPEVKFLSMKLYLFRVITGKGSEHKSILLRVYSLVKMVSQNFSTPEYLQTMVTAADHKYMFILPRIYK